MSNTKGSMLISNANAVGTELVNQLGGTGYKPSEWSDAINLLGISDDDKASALAGITEGTYTGNERGAIKYSNCNAVGAMLNKKFSTNRGFKPVEWESAISKLTPLAEGTVSGSICNIVNGADQVPLKNWLVTLPASLDGYTEANGTKSGANLFDGELENGWIGNDGSESPTAGRTRSKNYSKCKGNVSYYVTCSDNWRVVFYDSTKTFISYVGTYSSNRAITSPSNAVYFRFAIIAETPSGVGLNYPSTETSIQTPKAPTTYTASLGRTIYGGQADIVTGEGTENTSAPTTLNSRTWNKTTIGGNVCFYCTLPNGYIGSSGIVGGDCNSYDVTTDGQMGTDRTIRFYCSTSFNFSRCSIRDDRYADLSSSEFKAVVDGNIVYQLAESEQTNFTFEPITPTPETPLGVSNWWSEQGDSSITYRKDPDIPDPPVQLLNMNNNENNNNEGV